MKVEGERRFAVGREVVWGVLNSPAKMAALMPGVQSFEVEDDTHWQAKVKVPLGMGLLHMTIDFEKTDEREPEYSSLTAKGNGVGAIMNMTTSFTLEAADSGTTMHWTADVRILGPVGAMGQRILQPVVKQQVDQVLSALDRQVSAAAGSSSGDADSAAAATAE
jgi:carbon monoxide dehydrogenase subunit G